MAEPRRERKVVTVVFADLVGFTARSEELDPEDVEAILRPYHERLRGELERFGGTVEKFIGDAVMALFGAPVAHEDDPERAVRAALAIRDWAREDGGLEVRVAVNTGEALVSLGARPEQGEGMAAGDVVNTAARLQSAAPVNGILVGESTYRATRDAIDYREADPVEAKGKSEPVRVWEAVETRSRLGPDVRKAGRAPLVGRERELQALDGALERTREERTPQLVTLVGVPGIGKSRLVYELFRRLEDDPELIRWRQGASPAYGEGVSFWALGEMVKAQAGILEGDAPDVAAAKLRAAVEAVIAADEVGWVERHLRPLLGLADETEPAGERTEAFTAWRRFLEGLADESPLVLVFEDLHQADDALLDFVDHLVDWAAGVPILVVGTARPELVERRPGWGGGKLNAATLLLSPLDDEESARLVAALLDRAVLPAEAQQALLERAGGNPLYAEQYVRLFLERGTAEDLPLPESVQGIIAARLDSLPAAEKRLLQDAAVVGKVFWSGALAAVGGVEPASIGASLHALVRMEFVRRERRSSVAGQEELAFRHVLLRDVAYGQIPRAERADRHVLAARWIENLGRREDHAQLLAHHYGAALEIARAAGREALAAELAGPARLAFRDAGDRALALNAYAAAESFYRSALELWPQGESGRAQLVFSHGKSRFLVEERGEDVLAEASAMLEAERDLERAAEAEVILAEIGWKAGSPERLRGHLDRALALAERLPVCRAKALVLGTVSRFRMLAGESEGAIGAGREALAMAEELGLDEIRVHTLASLGPARVSAGDLGGLADLEQAIALGAAINSPERARAYTNLSAMHAMLGDFRRAGELEREGLAVAQRFGHEPSARFSLGNVAVTAYQLGDWETLLDTVEEFVAEGAGGRHHYLEAPLRLARAHVRIARGDLDGALDDAGTGLALARDANDPQILGPSLSEAAYPYWRGGRREAALALLDELFGDPVLAAFLELAEAAWLARETGREAAVRASLGTGERGRWPAALEAVLDLDYVRAADLYGEIGSLPSEAFCRLRAAERLVAEGRRPEADAQLDGALAFYRSVGATSYVAEAERLLAATA